MNSICFYYTAFGEKYKGYIPLCIHFLHRAFPGCGIIIDCKGAINPRLRRAINHVYTEGVTINENRFNDMTLPDAVGMFVRFAVCHPEFLNYEFTYFGDIDLMHSIETPNLLERRVPLMELDGLPYSNSDQIDDRPYDDRRMTGLHMVRSADYFDPMREAMNDLWQSLVVQNRYPDWCFSTTRNQPDDGKAIRVMLERSGFPMPKHPFFQYHGSHVGHSRVSGRWNAFFTPSHPEHGEQQRQADDVVPELKRDPVRRLITNLDVQWEVDTLIQAWDQAKLR